MIEMATQPLILFTWRPKSHSFETSELMHHRYVIITRIEIHLRTLNTSVLHHWRAHITQKHSNKLYYNRLIYRRQIRTMNIRPSCTYPITSLLIQSQLFTKPSNIIQSSHETRVKSILPRQLNPQKLHRECEKT